MKHRVKTMLQFCAVFFVLNGILAVMNFASATEAECVWVESMGMAYLDNVTPEQARAMAKRNAQAEAIAKVAGVEVKADAVMKDYVMQADLVKIMSEGVVVHDEEVKWEKEDDPKNPGDTLLVLHYKACVKPLKGERDPYFNVKLQMKEKTFVAGDETFFKINCTKDCYVTLFNITAENKVILLYPDGKYVKDNFLKEGKDFEFPPKNLRESGLKLRVKLLEGQKENTEIIEAVATKKKFDFAKLLCEKQEGRGFCDEKNVEATLEDFHAVLSEIPLSERSEDVEVYVVRRK